MKLLLLLRNPVERAFSHWRWISEHGLERLPFWDALQQEETRLLTEDWQGRGNHSYADRGRYTRQLERLWRYFPREQTLILRTTDLANQPQDTLDQVCAFLGISPHAFTCLGGVNTTSFKATMSPREEAYLRTIFEPEIKALEVLLGWDCSDWLQQPAVRSG